MEQKLDLIAEKLDKIVDLLTNNYGRSSVADVSYFANKLGSDIEIIRKVLTESDLNVDPDYFNKQFKKKWDK